MPTQRINQIETIWTVVMRAHHHRTDARTQGNSDDEMQEARRQLLEYYGRAARRYLLGAVRDEDLANELFQEFALRVLKGDLKRANQQVGRFRNYIKSILYRLVADHFRKKNRLREVDFSVNDGFEPDQESETPASGFNDQLRQDFVHQTTQRLLDEEKKTAKPFFTILDLRLKNPQADSRELATLASGELGKDISSSHYRVLLARARFRFASLLTQIVIDGLDRPSFELLQQELSELRLLEYCAPVLSVYQKRLND